MHRRVEWHLFSIFKNGHYAADHFKHMQKYSVFFNYAGVMDDFCKTIKF